MTILVTTHYLDEAERLCDRVAIMHAGEIVALDTPGGLLAGLGRELVELRVDGDAAAALARSARRGVAGDDAFASAPPSPCRCTATGRRCDRRDRRLRLSPTRVSADARPSTTSTCASPAAGSPKPPDQKGTKHR